VGDPASLVATSHASTQSSIGAPQFENLDTIIGHALTWEQSLDKPQNGYRGHRLLDIK
jgi:UDP-glucose 4-epimerase